MPPQRDLTGTSDLADSVKVSFKDQRRFFGFDIDGDIRVNADSAPANKRRSQRPLEVPHVSVCFPQIQR